VTISFSYECKRPSTIVKTYLLDIGYLAWMVGSAERLLEEAAEHPERGIFDYWFGDFGARQDAVYLDTRRKVQAMLDHARSHPFAFNQLAETTLAKTDQSIAALEIGLGTRTSLGIYSLGEMVVTLVHELSHKTPGLMTKDVPTGRSDTEGHPEAAYKTEAVKLALADPAKALQNAENWGYYVAAYHRRIGLVDEFKYTANESEISRKPPVTEVGPTRGEHWNGAYWIAHEGKGCANDPHGLPVARYRVTDDMVVLERARTPFPDVRAPAPSASSPGVVHVEKAVSSDGPHKCGKCGRGFLSVTQRYQHAAVCTG